MIPVDQTILHEPEKGIAGNCAQSAFASILDLDINLVPHFADGLLDNSEENGEIYMDRINSWLKTLGLGLISFSVGPEYLTDWAGSLSEATEYYLISGWTERETYHVCVGKDGEVVHDPHPSKSGLLYPTEDRPWSFDIIVKRL